MGKQLKYFVTVENQDGEHQTFGPGDDIPAWAVKKITNPSAWADNAEDDDTVVTPTPPVNSGSQSGEQGGGSGAGDPKPYSDWKKDELEAEVKKRNEGRDEADHIQVPAPGNKPELAAALDADDRADD